MALLLARGWTQVKAARAGGVCPDAVTRWLREPDFRRHVQALRDRLMDAAVGQLVAMSGKALGRLERLLESDSEQIAIQAIREWRSGTTDLGIQHDLARRIEEVDAAHTRQPGPTTRPDDADQGDQADVPR